MTQEYKGSVVEESLADNRALNRLKLIGFRVTEDEDPGERWHIYTVMASPEDIERLSSYVKSGWYMHFWKDRRVIVVFHGKRFEFDYDDRSAWAPAIEYGLAQGIAEEQLDFIID